MNVPQPAGVPVIRQSPGSSVMIELSHSIATGGGPICSPTSAYWRSSPLTWDWIRTASQSGSSSCVTMHGPIGQKVSKFLPRSRWPLWNWTERDPTSLKTV